MTETRWLLRLAMASAVACAVAIPWIDHPLAAWLATRDTVPGAWNTTLSLFEYAIGIEPWRWLGTIVLVAGTLVTWAVPRWHRAAKPWLFVTLSHLIAVNVMLWGKLATGRLRPHEWNRHAEWWLHGSSFPSGHIALVGSMIVPLAVVFPRARLPAAIFLAFVGCARIAVGAHWASDVFGGLVLVAIVTWACAAIVRRVPWPATTA